MGSNSKPEERPEVLVLDGGFSNELNSHCSFDVHKEVLWTAKALYSDPEAIVSTHLAYLRGKMSSVIFTFILKIFIKAFSLTLIK